MRERDIQRKIKKYISGELEASEIDNLWIEFLRAPEWYDYFITELHLVALFRSHKGENSDFVSP